MSIDNFIEKLRSRSPKERERIAFLATGVSFAIILVIWLISFSEMNKKSPVEGDALTIDQLKNLKDSATESKKSIEEMWNQMPGEGDLNNIAPPPDSAGGDASGAPNSGQNEGPAGNQIQDPSSGQNNQQEIPSLP
jgi:hypothetical protein